LTLQVINIPRIYKVQPAVNCDIPCPSEGLGAVIIAKPFCRAILNQNQETGVQNGSLSKSHRIEIMGDIRNQIERGWYPDNYSVLTKSLERYLKNVSTDKPEGKLIAIIVPHAGHKYSGQVAAYAFKCLEGMEFETVVVVSPFHYPHTGNIVTTSHMAYKTPLGLIDVDTHMLNVIDSRIKEKLGKGLSYISNDGEHAIEVELPFLQHLLSDFKLVPLMISNQTFKVARALGHAVSEAISNRNALLVASSDLSHYFPEEMANSFDSEMLRLIENFDPNVCFVLKPNKSFKHRL